MGITYAHPYLKYARKCIIREWIEFREFTWIGWLRVELCEPGSGCSPWFLSINNHWPKGDKTALMRHLWYRVWQQWKYTTQLSWSETHGWLTTTASAPSIHIAFSPLCSSQLRTEPGGATKSGPFWQHMRHFQ